MALSLENEEQGSGLSRDHAHTVTDALEGAQLPPSWPTTGQEFDNPWHRNATAFLGLIDQHRGFWGRDFDLKYLSLRIDTRNNQFVLLDRDGQRIHADRVLDAIRAHQAFLRPARASSASLNVGEGSRDTPEPSSPPEDERSKLSETTGYIEALDEPRPARATGEWSDVWSREDRSAKLSGGWVLVPREPTEAMLLAVNREFGFSDGYKSAACYAAPRVWRSMLSALPQDHAPVRGGEDSVFGQTASSTQCADAQARPTGGDL